MKLTSDFLSIFSGVGMLQKKKISLVFYYIRKIIRTVILYQLFSCLKIQMEMVVFLFVVIMIANMQMDEED
jgi:hypothetical protein